MQNDTLFPAGEAILEGLNPAQRAAVLHGSGPLLVIAGAGSGKTRMLVHRMAYLVAGGAAPESILLLTFTRKAAQNMLWRAAQLTGANCRQVMGGTFHATAIDNLISCKRTVLHSLSYTFIYLRNIFFWNSSTDN